MFYLIHNPSGQLAHSLATGEHDAAKTNRCADAKAFDNHGDASDFSQNFGSDWSVIEY
jgi:hypothetical protein